MIAVAGTTACTGFDERLPDEGRGQMLRSGGQWQALAVARGIYRRPALLICDEPTSSLDARAEHEVYRAIGQLAGRAPVPRAGKGAAAEDQGPAAVVLISHRPATVRTST